MTPKEKQKELIKLRDLNQATLDYHIQLFSRYPMLGYDFIENFKNLKILVEQYFQKAD